MQTMGIGPKRRPNPTRKMRNNRIPERDCCFRSTMNLYWVRHCNGASINGAQRGSKRSNAS
jgi:hypothetical protein